MTDDVKLPEPDMTWDQLNGSDQIDYYEAATVRRLIAEAVEREREACLSAVPDSWLDPLLTGPIAVIGKTANAADIEELLFAIRNRIRNRSKA